MSSSKRLANKLSDIKFSFGGDVDLNDSSTSKSKNYYELDNSDAFIIDTVNSKMNNVNIPRVKMHLRRELNLDQSITGKSETLLSPSSSATGISPMNDYSRNSVVDYVGRENYNKNSIDEGRERDRKVPNRSPKRSPSKRKECNDPYLRSHLTNTPEFKVTYDISDLDLSKDDLFKGKPSSGAFSPSTKVDSMRRSDSYRTVNS